VTRPVAATQRDLFAREPAGASAGGHNLRNCLRVRRALTPAVGGSSGVRMGFRGVRAQGLRVGRDGQHLRLQHHVVRRSAPHESYHMGELARGSARMGVAELIA
jgi:hypothetical protein